MQVRESRGQPSDGDTSVPLVSKRTTLSVAEYNVQNQRFLHWMRVAGFLGVFQVGFMRIDGALITALVERWRPETHTFHMPEGELTITLQDVAVLLGLRIDGHPITGVTSVDIADYCGRWLGQIPDPSFMRPRLLSLNWLSTTFDLTQLDDDATEGEVQRYVRATILRLIGGEIFGSKTKGYVHGMYFQFVQQLHPMQQYSWGSACLAHLYHNLCATAMSPVKKIAGPLSLLKIWAWERFAHCRPVLMHGPQHMSFSPLGSRYMHAMMLMFLFKFSNAK